MSALVTFHRAFRDHPLTGWACRIMGCANRAERPPIACVLLLVSVVMTTLALLFSLVTYP